MPTSPTSSGKLGDFQRALPKRIGSGRNRKLQDDRNGTRIAAGHSHTLLREYSVRSICTSANRLGSRAARREQGRKDPGTDRAAQRGEPCRDHRLRFFSNKGTFLTKLDTPTSSGLIAAPNGGRRDVMRDPSREPRADAWGFDSPAIC